MKRFAKFILIFIALCGVAQGWVMGIDLGTEWFKVALVRPRFDIALNDQSSRKTPSLVAYHQGELLIGTDAKNLITKVPSSVYSNAHLLLGRAWGDEFITEQIAAGLFPYKLVELRGGYGIYHDENITFAPEDVVAQLLSNAKHIASKAGNPIRDCVITVPPFYTQHQRQSVLDAAKIAGLNVLNLLNGPTAISINWAIDRNFEENSTHAIFYDMGATSTEVAVVSFKALPESKKNKTITQITIQGVAWDETLGGSQFDRKLVNHFLELVKQQHKVDVSSDKRAMAKLYKEAQKVKEVLSANSETIAGVEGLTSTIDFKAKITREKFEQLSADLFDRALKPIQQALADAEIKLDDVQFFEVVGGGVRIPKLQQRMKEFLNREDLDKHLNGDESAVMGAVFYGAAQSPAFRAREFKIKDLFPFETSVHFKNSDIDKETELFKEGSRYNSKKTVTFYAQDNFTFSVQYEKTENAPVRKELGTYLVSDLPTTARYNFTGRPKVHAAFRLNNNGLALYDKVEAEIVVTEVKLVPVKKEKTQTEQDTKSAATTETTDSNSETEETSQDSENSDESSNQENSGQDQKAEETATQPDTTTSESSEKSEEVEEEPEMEEKVTTKVHRVTLKVSGVDVVGMKEADFSHSKKIMADINRRTELKREREREKNNLESYIYDLKEKLETEQLIEVTTAQQRESFLADLEAAGEWLYEDGQSAEASEYKSKLDSLKSTGDKMFKRATEITARPESVTYARDALNTTKNIMSNISKVYDIDESEVEDILESVSDFEKWLNDKEREQLSKQVHEDPAFTSDQVYRRWKAIESKVKPLLYRKIRKPPKATNSTESTSNTTIPTQNEEQPKTEDKEVPHDEL